MADLLTGALAPCRPVNTPLVATCLAALTWLDLYSNAFTRVPPVLEAATALVSLDLYGENLQLSTADADGLLAGKPNLRFLHCDLLPGVHEHLPEAAERGRCHGDW